MKLRDRIRELRRVPASSLLPNPRNWRLHSEQQQNAMRGILSEVGIADAVLAYETDAGLMLIDGHLRAEIAPDALLPVLVLDVTDEEADKILLTHDVVTEMAATDSAMLDELLSKASFISSEIDEMLSRFQMPAEDLPDKPEEPSEPEIEEDDFEIPEVVDEIKTAIKPGDLFELGSHRLLCGDSTDADAVARLMDGTIIDLAFTSPPYNVGGNSKGGHLKNNTGHSKYISGDDKRTDNDYRTLLDLTLRNMLAHCRYAVINIQMLAQNKRVLIEWLHSHRSFFADVAIWSKTFGPPAMQDNVLNTAFEFLFVFSSKENPSRRIETASFRGNKQNVYTASRGERNEFSSVHAATFPVHLPAWVVSTMSESGDVLDLFLGCGTTLIAAEQLGRKCFGMEISPQYCQLIVNRYEKHCRESGKPITILRNGQPFTIE